MSKTTQLLILVSLCLFSIVRIEDINAKEKLSGELNKISTDLLLKCKDIKNEKCILEEMDNWTAKCGNRDDNFCLKISNFYKIIPGGEMVSLSYLNISCELKNKKSCKAIAKIHQLAKQGKPVPGYEAGCKKGTISNCVSSVKGADDPMFAPPTKEELAMVKQDFSKKCKEGDKQACLQEEFENEPSLSKSKNGANTSNSDAKDSSEDAFADLGGYSEESLQKCKTGNIQICKKVASNLLTHKQYSPAIEFLMPACSKNDADSCLLIGTYYAQTGQLKKSKSYFVKACNGNLYKGCLGAGLASEIQRDKVKYFDKSCNGKESFACNFLGDINFSEKQYGLALNNYEKSCLLENAEACEIKCTTLANLNSSAEVLDDCLKESCEKGNSKSCDLITAINNQINKSRDDYTRKRKMIDDAIEEDNRRANLFQGLSKASQQMGNALSGSNYQQESPTTQNYNDQTSPKSFSNSGTSTHKGPNNVCNCKGYAGVGGPCYDGPGGAAYSGVGGPAYAGPGGPCYDGVGGAAYSGVGGPAYKGVGGPAYDGVGGAAYDGVGGPAYSGVGGPCYAGPSGPCYSGVGGTGKNCPAVCK